MEDVFHLGIKALIRNSEGKFLLLQVNPAELKNYSGEAYWDLPGGRIQRGSTIPETLEREVEEETGLIGIATSELVATTVSNIRIPVADSDVGLILQIYVCDVPEVENIILSSEHQAYDWFTIEQVVENLQVKFPQDFLNQLLARFS